MEEKRRKKEIRMIVAAAVIFGALLIGLTTAAAAFAAYGGMEKLTGKGGQSTKRVYERLSSTATAAKVEDGGIQDLSGIVEEVMPSVVAITSTTTKTYYNFFGVYDKEAQGSGSGILFEDTREELLIMTNKHVVSGAKSIQITFHDGSIADGTVKGTDSNADLAVVSVASEKLSEETKTDIRMAKLGDTRDCKVGQMVLAIGNALGYGQSLTVGYVSARDRQVNVDDRVMTLLQTDAAINPGNSGGALINMQGEVIGINSVKYSAEAVEGMGYAIPMETALPILEELKKQETVAEDKRGYLGIYYEAVTDEMNRTYQIPYGIYISEVMQNGAAQKAGLYNGDVITSIDGREVKDTASMQERMQNYRVGDRITMVIQRRNRGGYQEMEIEITLGEMPQE